MQLHSRLVHADPQIRVVEVTARDGERLLGCALGEATGAEEAEDRAIARLLQRLGAAAAAVLPPVVPEAAAAVVPLVTTAPAPLAWPAPEPSPVAARPEPAPTMISAAEDPAPGRATDPAVAPAAEAQPAPSIAPAATDPAAEPSAGAAAPAASSVIDPAANYDADPVVDPPDAPAPTEPPADPEDWSAELAQIELQLRRIGWDRDAESTYLRRAFGHPSRSRITTYADLMAYLRSLEGLAAAADAAAAPVPLRRRDLLSQSQQLLDQLGWGPEEGRRFLAEQLGAASRQQLSDHQLLQFNMLLEGELIAAATVG